MQAGNVCGNPGTPAKPKVAEDFQQYATDAPVSVIIQLNGVASQALLEHIQARGGVVKQYLSFGRALQLLLAPKDVDALAADSRIAYVSPDRKVTATAVESTLDYAEETANATAPREDGLSGRTVGIRGY